MIDTDDKLRQALNFAQAENYLTLFDPTMGKPERLNRLGLVMMDTFSTSPNFSGNRRITRWAGRGRR